MAHRMCRQHQRDHAMRREAASLALLPSSNRQVPSGPNLLSGGYGSALTAHYSSPNIDSRGYGDAAWTYDSCQDNKLEQIPMYPQGSNNRPERVPMYMETQVPMYPQSVVAEDAMSSTLDDVPPSYNSLFPRPS